MVSKLSPKKWFLSSRKYDPGCSSRIPDPDADFLPIPDPGVKKTPDPGSATLVYCSVVNSVSDPDSIRSVDPDPYSESGSGSRRAKMTQKSRKIF
jgi:hypothetical protein